MDESVADIPDGATIMFGGFGGAGFPNNLIQGLARRGARNLRVISNNCGTGDGELGILFKNRQIRHVVAAFPGPGATYFQQQFDAGDIDLELVDTLDWPASLRKLHLDGVLGPSGLAQMPRPLPPDG